MVGFKSGGPGRTVHSHLCHVGIMGPFHYVYQELRKACSRNWRSEPTGSSSDHKKTTQMGGLNLGGPGRTRTDTPRGT